VIPIPSLAERRPPGTLGRRFLAPVLIGGCVLLAAPAGRGADDDTAPLVNFHGSGVEMLVPVTTTELEPGKDVVVTLWHGNDWRYGDNFGFVDFNRPGDIFAKAVLRLSLGKTSGRDLSVGPISDFLFAATFEIVENFEPRRLFGVGVSVDLPHFDFFKVNALHRNDPELDGASVQLAVSWGASFEVAGHKLDFSGFLDYFTSEGRSAAQIITQPQLWWDVGNELGKPDRYFIGIEVDCRLNKFGVDGVDEIVPQLAVGVAF